MSEQPRASFGGKLSVILVAAGSAIGLGALWRFPYVAGKHGGAAFLLVFLLSVLVVGSPAMRAEFERIMPSWQKGKVIPAVDHQTPPDVSVQTYKKYVQLLKEYSTKI